jgi:hypothetical protein
VTAGATTLIAGVIAWFSVQRQIEAQEQIEKRSIQRMQEQQETEAVPALTAPLMALVTSLCLKDCAPRLIARPPLHAYTTHD